jgi:hypothetical protein
MVNAYRKDQYILYFLTESDFQCEWCNISKRVNIDFPVFFVCSRYNRVRPPNNENNCTANPSEEEFLQQVQNAQYF